MRAPGHIARIIIFVVAVAAVVILIFVTGTADEKAAPGSGGRVPVTSPSTSDSP
jgi:hypothetical protein